MHRHNPLAINNQARAPKVLRLPLPAKTRDCSAGALATTNTFLFRDGCQNGENRISKDPHTVEILLGETFPLNTGSRQPAQVFECFEDSFTAEPVERPEQHQIELPLPCIAKHSLEVRPVRFAAGIVVHVLVGDLPALLPRVFPQGYQLVFGVLPFVLCADTSVQRDTFDFG